MASDGDPFYGCPGLEPNWGEERKLFSPSHYRIFAHHKGDEMAKKSTIKLTTITPAKAKKWLQKNIANNRSISRSRVAKLVGDIKNGAWHVTGDTIKFDQDDNLIDGQHRLSAIAEAGIPVKSYVATGVKRVALESIDAGRSRTVADRLALLGYRSAKELAAAASVLSMIESGKLKTSRSSLTLRESEDIVNRYGDRLETAIQLCWRSYTAMVGLPRSIVEALAAVALTKGHSKWTVEQFIVAIYRGGTAAGTPTGRFRDFLLDRKLKRYRIRSGVMLDILIRVFNRHVMGLRAVNRMLSMPATGKNSQKNLTPIVQAKDIVKP